MQFNAAWLLRLIERLTEAALIGMLAWSVWPFGSVHAYFELIVAYPLALILVLWALRMLLAGRPLGFDLPPAGQLMANGLLGLFLVAALQLLPLPNSLLQRLSPNVTPLVEELIPQPRERLASAEEPIPAPSAGVVGRSISLNPGGSYQFAIRLLALASLFLAVSSLPRPLATLRRLAVAMTIVGSCLAIFAIVRRLTDGTDIIYGYFTFPRAGSSEASFGPFINRNHYPYFANVCLGLAVGLLLERRERVGHRMYDLLQDTWSLLLLVSVGVIASSVLVCLSRAGVVAMLIGGLACLLVRLRVGIRGQVLTVLVGLVTASAVLVTWIGFDVLESRFGWLLTSRLRLLVESQLDWLLNSRLGLLLEAERYRSDGRWNIWRAAIPIIPQFPLFGAGGDTFRHLETIHSLLKPGWSGRIALRADNDFLDVAVEYGLFGLFSLVLLACGVVSQGLHQGRERPLAAGCLMGLLAVVVHSCLDFGLRIPANALLATSVAGLLAALRLPQLSAEMPSPPEARSAFSTDDSAGHQADRSRSVRTPLVSRAAVALLAVLVAGGAAALILEKRRYRAAEWWRLDAYKALSEDNVTRLLDSIQRAEAATPEDIQLHLAAAFGLLAGAGRTDDNVERGTLIDRALEHAVKARDLCPLACEPSLWLAEYSSRLAVGSSQLDYLLTAQRLNPTSADINFAAGALLYDSQRWDEVWPLWRDHLILTRRRLPRIMELAGKQLTTDEMLERLLPSDFDSLAAAAGFAQRAGRDDDRNKYLAALVQLAESKLAHGNPNRREMLRDPELAIKLGRAYRDLGRPKEAIGAFNRAVSYRPTQLDWRVELARLLIETGQLTEARRQLRIVLDMQPEHRAGQQLRLEVDR